MTRENRIRAVLETNFSGFKEEIIESATKIIIDVTKERHGKWIDAECYSKGCDDGYICSEGRRITYRTMTPYCMYCGAKMNEVSE